MKPFLLALVILLLVLQRAFQRAVERLPRPDQAAYFGMLRLEHLGIAVGFGLLVALDLLRMRLGVDSLLARVIPPAIGGVLSMLMYYHRRVGIGVYELGGQGEAAERSSRARSLFRLADATLVCSEAIWIGMAAWRAT